MTGDPLPRRISLRYDAVLLRLLWSRKAANAVLLRHITALGTCLGAITWLLRCQRLFLLAKTVRGGFDTTSASSIVNFQSAKVLCSSCSLLSGKPLSSLFGESCGPTARTY